MPRSQKSHKREAEKSGKPDAEAKQDKADGKGKSRSRRSDGTRETVESIVVAFILAFLFRTFEAEAFVIPTGSMAPTLYGRHIEFTCRQCGMNSVVGASSELDRNSDYYIPSSRITTALCPNCRYENPVFDHTQPRTARGLPAFKGDRILVNKFPYEFWDPQRWDVVVFKYPEDPKTNYIKRLVGLPGEEIKIEWGDVFVRKNDNDPFRIARKKDANKQRLLQLLVYDNDWPARKLHKWGWPERWAALKRGEPDDGGWVDDRDGWQADYEARTFEIDAVGAAEDRMIRYRHFVPTPDVWQAFDAGRRLEQPPRPILITDYCPYNAYRSRRGDVVGRDDVYWVGDLTLNLEVDIRSPQGQLVLELVKGNYRYSCRFDLQTGKVTLFYVDGAMEREPPREELPLGTAETKLNREGSFEISFANVDQRLCLWIDDKLIDFGSQAEYGTHAHPAPQPDDLAPVGIAARGCSVKVSHLRIQRDIYYRADQNPSPDTVHESGGGSPSEKHQKLLGLLDDPQKWYELYDEGRRAAVFENLGPDEFFMMGDNSPHSQDSRLWPNTRGAQRRHAVPRSALVGKAFYIYWPHGIPFMNDGRGYGIPIPPVKRFSYHQIGPRQYPEDLNPPEQPYYKFTVPFYPNVTRMRRIR